MLMLPRFMAPGLDPQVRHVTLPADESHHLTRVLRLGVGAEVAVFDGQGREFRARVLTAGREDVRLELLEPLEPAAEPRIPIALILAVLKGDGMDAAVRDATMMGVTTIVPVLTEHVAVPAQSLESGKAVARWRRVALASAKQCRRATLPAIDDPQPLETLLASAPPDLRLLLVEPSAPAAPRSLRSVAAENATPAHLAVLVGPEGGWAASEIAAAAAAGFIPATLGPVTLRADATPLVALAMCRALWEI